MFPRNQNHSWVLSTMFVFKGWFFKNFSFKLGDMLEEPLALVPGWSSYYGFSRKRTGYSGVATFCRSHVTPVEAQEGLAYPSEALPDLSAEFSPAELKDLEAEGRAVVTIHQLKVRNTFCNFWKGGQFLFLILGRSEIGFVQSLLSQSRSGKGGSGDVQVQLL